MAGQGLPGWADGAARAGTTIGRKGRLETLAPFSGQLVIANPCRIHISPFYYRILSPVILVEFDHQSGIIYDNDTPSRDHIHTVVRTPNGNDYGKDLLRQHYAELDHSHPTTAHRHRTA